MGNLLILLAIVVFAVAGYFIWDRRYRGDRSPGDFQPTAEVFKDPTTGKLTRVWEDSATGKRQYREEPAPSS